MKYADIINKDVEDFVSTFKLTNELEGSRFLITGATGLIGSILVKCLLALDNEINIICPIRNLEKAYSIFGNNENRLFLVECQLLDFLNDFDDEIDYIIHCASPTSGKYMSENPVETYELAFESTRLLLNYASRNKIKGMVYISSLEYYGQNYDDRLVSEDFVGYIDYSQTRSSYQVGKRSAEFLCNAYSKEYDVNVKIARLTQTFGVGVARSDNRVFAQFARSIISGTNIVLHTIGESSKPYCYTTDCVSGILYILLKGSKGEAYNVANQDTYISIKDMAEMLCKTFNSQLSVCVDLQTGMGYAPITKLRLSSKKLMDLGWKPNYDLKEMYGRLILSLKND